MPSAPSRLPRLAALTALALVPLSGCGSDEAASTVGQGLAHVVPASALFYGEVQVRPDHDTATDLDAIVDRFAPGKTAEGLIRHDFPTWFKAPKPSLDKDVLPWLGVHAAAVVTAVHPRTHAAPDWALLFESTDNVKARAALAKDNDKDVTRRTYQGVQYFYDHSDHQAFGLVDGTVVGGTRGAFKAIVRATRSGSGLGDQERYKQVIDPVDDGAFGFVFGDFEKTIDVVQRVKPGGTVARQAEPMRRMLELQGLGTFGAGLFVTNKTMKVRMASVGVPKALQTGGEPQVAALPGGAWAGSGSGSSDLGAEISATLDRMRGLTGSGIDVGRDLEHFRRQTDIDVEKDLLPWMGGAGLFVHGASKRDLGGALVIETKDPAATRLAMGKLRTMAVRNGLHPRVFKAMGIDDGFSMSLRGLPVRGYAALSGKRFVFALTRPAVDAALSPAKHLGDDPAFKAAAKTLDPGMAPASFVDVPKVAGLFTLACHGVGCADLRRTLSHVATVVTGHKHEGTVAIQTTVVALR